MDSVKIVRFGVRNRKTEEEATVDFKRKMEDFN